MLTEKQKQEYMNQFNALLHAQVDGTVAFVEARHKALNRDVLVACVVRQVEVPPRVMGGTPQTVEQIVPIFEFVDPRGDNPYESPDPGLVDVQASPIIVPDPHAPLREAIEASKDPANDGSA